MKETGAHAHLVAAGYWLDQISDFDTRVVYEPGTQNVVADAIPRRLDFISVIPTHKEDKKEGEMNERNNRKRFCERCADFGEVWERFRNKAEMSKGKAATKSLLHSGTERAKRTATACGSERRRVGERACRGAN